MFPNLRTAQENVVIAPTAEQITNSTEELVYSSDVLLSNTSCPITLEDFQDGDALQRILQCRHTFKRAAIQNWFQRNVRCPVCRCDIRDYLRPEPERPISPITTEPVLDPSMNDANFNTLFDQVSSNFSNTLNNYYSGNPNVDLLYSIEMSGYIDEYDASMSYINP